MLTRNFYKVLAARQFSGAPDSLVGVDGSSITNSTYGRYTTYDNIAGNITSCPSNGTMKYSGVYFGDGSAEPSIDDYKLSGNILSTLSTSGSTTKTIDDEGATITRLYTITNSGTSDFTIREIGLVSTAYNDSTGYGDVMFDRTVLDEPVTIPAGGIGQVTYTIRMDYPT